MKTNFLKDLLNPPKRFRPVPFWSWNEKLNVQETRRQIAEMEAVGIGGYFMHARGGLQTEYMGDDWMANVAAGVDEARDRHMEAWAYDENGWPSGFGDGKVNGLGETYQQKYLRYTEGLDDFGHRQVAQAEVDGHPTITFYYDVNPFYVDTLDAEVTRLFLEGIYGPYADKFAADFGGAMPGFFTDEPQVSRAGIPWSLTMPRKYQEAYGEDILPLLPQLFLEVGDFPRTRYRFWKLVQELFVTCFTQQIFDWVSERGGQLTGHMVLEETLHSQLTSNGAVMPHYEFFHMPGMDWLCRSINPPTTPLQVASVAHQLGKPAILSETFALTGWNVSFEELKWMFEWQMVRGITRLCQHLEGYSLRGIRKRDYPPSLFYQQPWWAEDYKPFNDAMSRIGMLLSKGKPAFEVLVIHPQSSAWLHYDEGKNPGLRELDRDFLVTTQALEAAHVPFHYGDERILLRHGRVDRGLEAGPGPGVPAGLVVGTQRYRAVVIPSTDTLDSSTASLLRDFAQCGGALLWTGRQPHLRDGEPSAEIEALCGLGTRLPASGLHAALLPLGLCSISVADAQGQEIGSIAATCRYFGKDGGCVETDCLGAEADSFTGAFYFLANADASQDYDATVSVPGADVKVLDILTGELQAVPFTVETAAGEARAVIHHRFLRRGSLALLVDAPEGRAAGLGVPAPGGLPLSGTELEGPWELELEDPNSLTLDYCDIWFDGQLVAEKEHISVVQSRALALERAVEVALRFEVEVAEGFTPAGELFLVLEQPERYRLELNGLDVPVVDCGMYRDKSFRKVDIAGRLRPGTNELWLRLTFVQSPEVYESLRKAAAFESEKNKLTYDTEVEAIYLIGDFGVACEREGDGGAGFVQLPKGATRYSGSFTLVPLPTAVVLGDLTPQGLPFFNGTVHLTKKLDLREGAEVSRSIELAEAMAQVVKLHVNGALAKSWYWRPYSADLTGLLRAGENELRLTLTSGLRNLLGPHHMQEGESHVVAPNCFFKEPNIWGHTAWNDGYCFVHFGVEV